MSHQALGLAAAEERMRWVRRSAIIARCRFLRARLLSPEERRKLVTTLLRARGHDARTRALRQHSTFKP